MAASSVNLSMIAPLVICLVAVMWITVRANRSAKQATTAKGFVEEYFLGSRSMGGFVLAMAIITTYTSASSFIGGPGVAYKIGLGWILLAMIQVPTAFLTLGVLGKRFAIVSRRIGAVTVTDFLRARYKNDFVVIFASAALIVFLMASMLAQFIGGARLFQTITGYPYIVGLILFGLTVVIYTSVGGFRAVVLTDTIQGIMMVLASVAILFAVVHAGGGAANIMKTLREIDPALITPYGPALNPPSLLVWINLFAFGGLEAVFLWPTVLGLYWKRAMRRER